MEVLVVVVRIVQAEDKILEVLLLIQELKVLMVEMVQVLPEIILLVVVVALAD